MKITYLGTTVLLFDDGINQVIFDAYFTRHSFFKAVFGKLKTSTNIVDGIIDKYGINRLKGIFISHTHIDHVLDCPYLSNKTGAEIYGSFSAMNVARGGMVSEEKLHCYDDSLFYKIGDFDITILPSVHSKPTVINNDLGQPISNKLIQPARMKEYKEGGSYDFIVKHREKTYVIRPSFNYIKGQFDNIKADVLFLGIGGLSKADDIMQKAFFEETAAKLQPDIIYPLHWDNFFKPLGKTSLICSKIVDDTEKSLTYLADYCGNNDICCSVILPMTSVEI